MQTQTSFIPDKIKYSLLCILTTLFVVLLTYSQLLSTPYFISEIPAFYLQNQTITPTQWLASYNPLQPGDWYRPTGFITFFQVMSKIIAWNNIAGWQYSAMLMMTVIGFVSYLFYSSLFTEKKFFGCLIAALVAMHPVFYKYCADLIHFDGLYIIALVLNAVMIMKIIQGHCRRKILLWFCVTVLYIFSLTCKEQSVAFPFWIVWVLLVDFIVKKKSPGILNICSVSLLICISLVFAFMRYKVTTLASGEYRTGADFDVIFHNIISGTGWLFHLFISDSKVWSGYNAILGHPLSQLFGVTCLLLALYGIYKNYFSTDKENRGKCLYLCGWIGLFSVLPFYSGGRTWHYALPVLGTIIFIVEGLSYFVQIKKFRKLAFYLVTGWLLLGVGVAIRNVRNDQKFSISMYRINYEAVSYPPVPVSDMPKGSTVVYFTNNNIWPFGCGALFRFAYQDISMKEYALGDNEMLTPAFVSELTKTKNLYYFRYAPDRHPAWQNETEKFKQHLAGILTSQMELPLNGFLKFQTGENGLYYLRRGWSDSELSGTWTASVDNYIELPVPQNWKGGLEITARCVPYLPSSQKQQTVKILCAGEILHEYNYVLGDPSQDQSRFVVPERLLNPGGTIILDFKIDSPRSPLECEGKPDGRKLGIMLISLEFKKQI